MSGCVAVAAREYATAQTCFKEGLAIGRMLDDEIEIVSCCLEGMASLAVAQGQQSWAVQLWSTAAHLREKAQDPLPPVERHQYENELAHVREFLGERHFAALWESGRTLTIDEALAARWKQTNPSVAEHSFNYYTGAGCTGTDGYSTSTNVPGYQAFSDYWCFAVGTSLDPSPSGC